MLFVSDVGGQRVPAGEGHSRLRQHLLPMDQLLPTCVHEGTNHHAPVLHVLGQHAPAPLCRQHEGGFQAAGLHLLAGDGERDGLVDVHLQGSVPWSCPFGSVNLASVKQLQSQVDSWRKEKKERKKDREKGRDQLLVHNIICWNYSCSDFIVSVKEKQEKRRSHDSHFYKYIFNIHFSLINRSLHLHWAAETHLFSK